MTSNPEDSGKKNPKPESEGKLAAQYTSEKAPFLRTPVEIPDAILKEYRASQEKGHRENKINRWIAIAAVAGAWLYAGIAVFQWCEMRETNSTSQNTLHQAYRPWITIEIVDNIAEVTDRMLGPGTYTAGYEAVGAVAHAVAKNAGTSPAIHGFTQGSISTGATADMVAQENADCEAADAIQRTNLGLHNTGYVVFPDEHSHPFDLAMSRKRSDLTDKNYLVGCTVYTDQYGTNHHTRFCFRWIEPKNTTESIQPCPENWDAD